MYSQAVDLHTTNAHSSNYYLRNCKQLTLLISAHAFPSNSLAGSSVVAPELTYQITPRSVRKDVFRRLFQECCLAASTL